MNGEYVLSQDINASDTATWNGGAGFSPIGTNTQPFTGKIYGNGHVIRNLYINRPSQNNIGLIGYAGGGAEIKYLRVENASIVGGNYVGIMVGYNNGGVIEDCHTSGSVSGSQGVGGIVGENRNIGTVIRISSSATIS